MALIKEQTKEQKTEEELKSIEQETKPKQKFWFSSIPPIVLIGGAVIIFFAYMSMTKSKDNSTTYIILILIVIIVLYLLSKQSPIGETLVTPEEAELLVMKEMRRKAIWDQWPLNSEVRLRPINNIIHRNAKPMYYVISAEVSIPYVKFPKYYTAKVMMSGPERGFVSFVDSVSPVSGREIPQEKSILPEWFKMARGDSMMQRFMGKMMR